MEPKFAVERFIFLGNLKPVYVSKDLPVDIENFKEYSSLVENIEGDEFIEVIKKCLECKHLPSTDKIWYIYAVYLLSATKQLNKYKVSTELANLAKTSEDLFLFVKYCKQIRESNNQKLLSNSARNAVSNWYDKIDLDIFADMLSKNSHLHGFTHRDLISICHVNTSRPGMKEILAEAYNSNKVKDAEEAKNDKTKEIPEYLKKFRELKKFKRSSDLKIMKNLVKQKKIKYEHVPTTSLRKIEAWDTIVPIMRYYQLMENVCYLIERKFFENVPFSKMFLKALSNREAMISENIHPISFLFLKSKLVKATRYSESVKQSYHLKKNQAAEVKISPHLNKKVTYIFEHSFENYTGESIRTFITINLAENSKRQCVINQKQVTCFEAGLTLALSYYKSERNAVLYTFTPEGKLKNIELKKNCGYVKANDVCQKLMSAKNSQKLTYPLTQALEKEQSYDLFLIIVATAAYGNSNGKPDQLIEALKVYQEKKNKNAKVVIVNMRRFNAAMKHEIQTSDGILEICGVDENTPKIINAFSLGYFK